MSIWRLILLAWAGLLCHGGGAATAQEPSPALHARADQLVALIRTQSDPAALFSPAFLAQVPPAQVRAISVQLIGQYGAVRGLGPIQPRSPESGQIDIEFERATVHMMLVVDAQEPHQIAGLLITGADVRGDSMAAILAEVRALPGLTGLAVARLGDGPPVIETSLEPDRPLAIGSTFKLFILAELDRQIRAGERRWSDVVTLDRYSIPSGTLQSWPAGSPLTLHSLAAMMISVSDNTATDRLLHAAGRENVERMMIRIGVGAAARNRPLLSTLEMARLKTGPAAALAAWRAADEAGRRRILAADREAADGRAIDITRFTGNPTALDVEWYASPADLVRTMDWLRREGSDTARSILAINGGVGAQLRGQLAYVGYKGGSEPGVINLTWLVRNRAGAWYAVTAGWNNPAAPVEEGRLVALMARAVQLLR
ncbi:MAG TPA: serine hydrolase [Allosphingosinicella sp.]